MSSLGIAGGMPARSSWFAGLVVGLLLPLAAPGVAVSSGTVLSSDPSAVQVDVLNGVVVWAASGRIYVRRAGVTRRTQRLLRWDLPEPFEGVRSGQLDLGLDQRGRVVATFNACADGCPPQMLDVATMEIRPLRVPVPRGCSVGAAALWRSRVAFGVRCARGVTRVEVRELGRSHRIGPRNWPDQNPYWPSVRRVDLRGTIALAFVNTGEVTLLDANQSCRRVVDARYNDGQVPSYTRTLSPHLSGNLITWGTNSFYDDQTGRRFTGSGIGTAVAQTNCRIARSPWAPAIAYSPINYRHPSFLADSAELTSAALDGNRAYVTVSGTGLVTGPY